jgi:hypothetical protein
MLADQFVEAAAGLDEFARKLWRAHGEGHLSDADTEEAAPAAAKGRQRAS